MKRLMKFGEARISSADRRNMLAFEAANRKHRIDRTETSFAGQSTMTMKDLKEAAKRRREIGGKY